MGQLLISVTIVRNLTAGGWSMSKGIGRLQRALLAAIQERGCVDTLEAARHAYKVGPCDAVTDAQHVATRRALAGLAKRGLVVHLGRCWDKTAAQVGYRNGEQAQSMTNLIAGAIGGGKAGEIDPATLERFRTMLNPRRERYPLAVVMQRLAAEAGKKEDQFEWFAPPQGEDPTVPRAEWAAQEAELIVEIANCGPLQPSPAPKPGVGRPPAVHERYVALLVGMVFHEYTLRSPKRIWDHDHRAEYNSPFYKFAEAVFLGWGLPRVGRHSGKSASVGTALGSLASQRSKSCYSATGRMRRTKPPHWRPPPRKATQGSSATPNMLISRAV